MGKNINLQELSQSFLKAAVPCATLPLARASTALWPTPCPCPPAHTSNLCPLHWPGCIYTTVLLAGVTGLSQHQREMLEEVQPTSAVVEEGQEDFG